ncbi:hypothetical protein [Pseudomonas sp. FR229a]|uniref:hypothetical protein n=1 Tax=Pseudomonas sp. FR229a TaxID=3040313 RepID=UPI002555ADC8|nr:hypothetical protein [Pseudomonas sp. FR229a]
MSYGLQFLNSGNSVVLDSEYARLCVIESGRYIPNATNGYGSITSFSRVVTSQNPPLVFVRPDTVAGIAQLGGMKILGSPGNWTGFYIGAYSQVGFKPNGRYFVSTFGAQPVASYGMRLWDGSSNLLFDSGTASATFTRAFQNWTFFTYELGPQGETRSYYVVDFNFTPDEYLLINNFGMNMCSGGPVPRSIYNWWDFSAGKLYAVTVAFANPIAFYLPAVFAKISV